MIRRKYGQAYIDKAENNVDKQVDENLVAKLQIHLPSEAFVMIRLKQICKEKNIQFDFANEFNEIPGLGISIAAGQNPYGDSNNPYGQPSDFPFPQENNNGPPNNSTNPYGNNPYGPPPDNGNPYGPPPDNGNPYGPPPDNGNPYGPPPDNGNPYGPPPDNGNPYQSQNN